jgi:plastocyanin
MTRWLRALLPPAIVALGLPAALLLAPATALAGDPCFHGFDMPSATVARTSQVQTLPCAFSPTVAYVPVGTTVTFVNDAQDSHLVTGANQEWGSRDVALGARSRVTQTFDKAGVYPYACSFHTGMVGAIVVGADGAAGLAPGSGGAAPAAASTPAPAAADQPMDGGRIAIAAAAGAVIALAVAWFVRGMRRQPVVKEIGS